MRLRKTHETDPSPWATGGGAVAHGWVRPDHRGVNLFKNVEP
jgi:hypothetical protein